MICPIDHVKNFGEVNRHGQRAVWGKRWLKPRAMLRVGGREEAGNSQVFKTDAMLGGGKTKKI